MVIDFIQYRNMKLAREAAIKAEQDAEIARREHLAMFLSSILAELEAA